MAGTGGDDNYDVATVPFGEHSGGHAAHATTSADDAARRELDRIWMAVLDGLGGHGLGFIPRANDPTIRVQVRGHTETKPDQ